MARKNIHSQRDTQHFRIINILTRLSNRQTLKFSDLAAEYNVDLRSIQRDFVTIEACGYEIERAGKGARKFADGFTIAKAALNLEQQAALIMLNEVAKKLGSPLQQPFQAVFESLVGCQPGSDLPDIVPVMPQNLKPPKLDELLLAQVQSAINKRCLLDIKYLQPGRAEPLDLRFGPLKLIVTEGATYVVGQREAPPYELTVYRLDRIKDCRFTGGAAQPEKPYAKWRPGRRGPGRTHGYEMKSDAAPATHFTPRKDIAEILGNAHSIWGVTEPRKKNLVIKLKVSGWAHWYFRGQKLVADQKATPQADGSLLYEGRLGHFMEIIPHILRNLPDVAVLSPQKLKDEIDARVNSYLRK